MQTFKSTVSNKHISSPIRKFSWHTQEIHQRLIPKDTHSKTKHLNLCSNPKELRQVSQHEHCQHLSEYRMKQGFETAKEIRLIDSLSLILHVEGLVNTA